MAEKGKGRGMGRRREKGRGKGKGRGKREKAGKRFSVSSLIRLAIMAFLTS